MIDKAIRIRKMKDNTYQTISIIMLNKATRILKMKDDKY